MRLPQVSHRWNDLAIEHLGNRKNLPKIKRFILGSAVESGHDFSLISIPNELRNFFGVEKWHHWRYLRAYDDVSDGSR